MSDPTPDPLLLKTPPLLRVLVTLNPATGDINVGGHLDNADVCVKMLIEAAHMLINRPPAEKPAAS